MKFLSFIFILTLSSLITSQRQLTQNIPLDDSIIGESIKYYTIPIERDLNGIPKDISISSQLISTQNSQVTPIIVVSKKPFPNTDKKNHQICGKVGETCTIPYSFINKPGNENANIAVYCENCQYRLNVAFNQAINMQRNLVEESVSEDDGSARVNYFAADGVAALSVAFLMIFVCVIACVIMMDIYVHNTQLVEQPMKLGRVEG